MGLSRRFRSLSQNSLETLIAEQKKHYNKAGISNNPRLNYRKNAVEAAEAEHSLERSQWLPDLSLQYREQQIGGTSGFYGFYAGIKIPLWFRGQKQRSQAAAMEVRATNARLEDQRHQLEKRVEQIRKELFKLQTQIDYYKNEQLALADELLQAGQKSYEAGDINYVTYVNYIDEATGIKQSYLDLLFQYLQQHADWQQVTGQ